MTNSTTITAEIATTDLLAELHRRGTLSKLSSAVGALHDHLSNSGAMDGASPMVPYLVYRLRREEAAVAGGADGARSASFWNDKIATLG